jgi:hypothetical protein
MNSDSLKEQKAETMGLRISIPRNYPHRNHRQTRRAAAGVSIWEDRLSDLADYRKIHGHCNVPKSYGKKSQLAGWVTTKGEYRLPSRWGTYEPDPGGGGQVSDGGLQPRLGDRLRVNLPTITWKYGHCNVPRAAKTPSWLVGSPPPKGGEVQVLPGRGRGRKSPALIQSLVSRFPGKPLLTAWEDRLSELADYHPTSTGTVSLRNNNENQSLGIWVHPKEQLQVTPGETSS